MTLLLDSTPGVVSRIVPIYTLFNTVSAAPHWVPASFLSKANFHIAFASALLMCVFHICLLSRVIPRYVALSVCCSSVSCNIIFMGFDLVDKVKCVVKDFVLFIFTYQSCAQFGVVFWQLFHILLCSIGLSRLHILRTSPGMKIY